MIANTITRRIRIIPGRIIEALARIDAVCKIVHPDAEQVVAIAGWQIVAAEELEHDVVFGGAKG